MREEKMQRRESQDLVESKKVTRHFYNGVGVGGLWNKLFH